MQRIAFLSAILLTALLHQPTSAQDIPVPPDLSPGDKYHIVFASNSTFSISSNPSYPPPFGTINSLEGSDWQVTFSAFNVGFVSGWNGVDAVWTAIMSDSTVDAIDRVVIEGPIYNTNLDRIANDSADLWDGSIQNPILYDENGVPVASNDVWTGSTSTGIHTGSSCGDWNDNGAFADGGDASIPSGSWVAGTPLNCSDAARIYGISPAYMIPQVLGDVDQNGVVNLLDVDDFIDRVGTGTYQYEADCNEDGEVNLLDVDAFVAILSGG